ncbi:MAG: ABC transporter permease, partial [Betaproteobacteria bacterium]
MMRSPFAELTRMLVYGAWSQNHGRLALTILAIALGVALGTAVHLVNHSAATEFEVAVRALSGNADLQINGPRSGFDEEIYPRLARRAEVAVASPLVELDAKIVEPATSMRVIGIDPFRALMLQPGLLGDAGERLRDLLRPGTVMLSSAAARQLGLSSGDAFEVQVGLRRVSLRVVATLPVNEALRQPVILMDIASAQWTFDHVGRITRIDLRLRAGAQAARVLDEINRDLPPGVVALEAGDANEQGLALSRAYRVNLNMLALVSLFTGAVLVFSTQTLSVLRRRTHIALLRALGVSRRAVTSLLTLEAAIFGAAGTVAGLALGVLAAHLAIAYAGADLGAGYFSGVVTRTSLDPFGISVIALCGIVASVLGGIFPAIEAGRAHPAAALRAGDEQTIFQRLPRLLPGGILVVTGGGLSLLPAVDGLPVFGYAAVACLLLGALLLMPAYVRWVLARVPLPRRASAWLALQQLRGAPGYAGISLAAVLAAFSLTVAMLIMIQSFRGSLDTWLSTVLPADLYARAGAGASAWIDVEAQARLLAAAPVARVAFSRFETVRLDPSRPAITVIARDLDPENPEALPLVSPQRLPSAGAVPAWISEAMRDVYGLSIGERLRLPLAGKMIDTVVAGVWRDYVRQGGAVL